MSLSIAFAWVVALLAGGAVGFLLARRGRDAAVHRLELELVTLRSQVAARELELSRVTDVSAEVAEARAARKMLEGEVTRLQGLPGELAQAAARLARAEAELDSLSVQAERVPSLEERVQSLSHELTRREAELRSQRERREQLEVELDSLRPLQDRVQVLDVSLARATQSLEAEKRRAEERLADAERDRQTLKIEVRQLGQQLLDEKGKALLDLNKQGLEGLLGPVRESFKTFQEQFQRSSEESIRDRASLLQQVRSLQEAQGKLSADANALSRALVADSRTQGDFGEAVLERLLESAGLQQGVHFDLQLNHVNEDGRNRRPDALVYLPGDRAIVIDAKCSLTAFTASMRTVDEDEREMDLKAHLESMRAHVRELCRKDYTSVLKQRSPDFVLMFVPSEAAFQTAISKDPTIVDDAYRASRVVICSPTTVLATLQMVHHVWRTERQTTHANRIAEEAGKMVDKLAGVIEAFSRVGAQLDLAQSALGEAKLRLSTGKGSLLSLANKVTSLGARAKTEKLAAANRQVALEAELEDEPAAPEPEPEPLSRQGQLSLDATVE